jgi:hypothetical protein
LPEALAFEFTDKPLSVSAAMFVLKKDRRSQVRIAGTETAGGPGRQLSNTPASSKPAA